MDFVEDEYKLYVAASGISNKAQRRALLLHVGGPGLREIFSNFSAEQMMHLILP